MSLPSTGVYDIDVLALAPCNNASLGAGQQDLLLLFKNTERPASDKVDTKCVFRLNRPLEGRPRVLSTSRRFKLSASLEKVRHAKQLESGVSFTVRVKAQPLRAGREVFEGQVQLVAVSAKERIAFPRVLGGPTHKRAENGEAFFSGLSLLSPGEYKIVAVSDDALSAETEAVDAHLAASPSLR